MRGAAAAGLRLAATPVALALGLGMPGAADAGALPAGGALAAAPQFGQNQAGQTQSGQPRIWRPWGGSGKPVASQSATAAEAFRRGQFGEAAILGRREGSVAGLIVAGRATTARAAFETRERTAARDLLRAAEADFDAVLARDPDNSDALLHKGIALAIRAKLDNSSSAARAARSHFQKVIAARPSDSLAIAWLGAWHGEWTARMGALFAATSLGARAGYAHKHFETAMAMPNASLQVPVLYATALLALSPGNAEKARQLLEKAVRQPPRDGVERLMRDNARAILLMLQRNDVQRARDTARRLAPVGMVS